VFVEARGHRQHKGGLYAVRVRLELPGGKELAASRNPPQDHAHEDAYVAIRDVFRALRRQLREHAAERRESVKTPDSQPHGVISELFAEKGYGFIRADDGRTIYFHRNSLLGNDFSRLRVGAEVHFAEEEGDQGPQASTVRAFGVAGKAKGSKAKPTATPASSPRSQKD
jgi:cold shock CspA family protein